MHELYKNIRIISKKSYMLDKPSPGLPWVLRVAMEHWRKDYFFDRPSHNNCFLTYVQDGKICVKNRKETLEAGPGDVIYITNEEISHELTVNSGQGTRVIIIIFRGKNSFRLIHRYLGKETSIIKIADPARVELVFQNMFDTARKGYPKSNEIVSNFVLPTLQTIEQESKKAGEKTDPELMLFHKCVEYINHNYLKIKSVSTVADEFAITHSKLCKLFKDYENSSPHKVLLKRKMTHAVYELYHELRNVNEIAYELGFSDPYSFSKAFKRVMGYNPSEAKDNPTSH